MSHFRGRPLLVRDILYSSGFLWAQGIVDLSRKEPEIVTALLLGLASGVGFGVSEGITYASNYYNGIQTAGIYGVRFISCVALHSMWSAAAAITAFERQRLVKEPIKGAGRPASVCP